MVILVLASSLAGCGGRTHSQEEGCYALVPVRPDGIIRDECQLLADAAANLGARLSANVLLPIGGQACQLQLVDIHLDATTASLDPTRFNGQIRIITSTPRPETCVCQAWFEYQASLSNSQSICP